MSLKTTAAIVALLLCPQLMPAQNSTKQTLSGGPNLEGWHINGGQWQAKNGEIAGIAGAGGGGWLVLNKGYEDVALDITLKCDGCKAGVIVREAPLKDNPDRMVGLYVSLAGPDASAIYRLTLDKQGKEMERKLISARVEANEAQPFLSAAAFPVRNRDGHYFSIKDLPDGWKHFHYFLRADTLTANIAKNDKPDPAGVGMPRYGQVALRVESGEVRFKNVELYDMTAPMMGFAESVTGPGFREIKLTDRFYSEGIAAADVNHDGVMDVVSGPFAYLGPDFHHSMEIFPPLTYSMGGMDQQGLYTDSFMEYMYDFNGDGWPDLLKVNFNGAYLYINPKGEARHWDEYKVVNNVGAETTELVDVDADGKPELIMSTGIDPVRVVGYAKPDAADVTKPWTIHAVSTPGSWSSHGMGAADINGDGRVDILQGSGWWEQPAAGPASGVWKFHPVPFGREPNAFIRGSDLLVYDVNGDGLPDVITSYFSHGPGLAWFEQHRAANGDVTFTQHLIMDSPKATMAERKNWEETDKSVAFTELHALGLADMDGDGVQDIVTGKRWWSHGIGWEENDVANPPVMYWFKLVRKPGGAVEFVPHIINNYTGLGTQIWVGDVNGDGVPDVLTAARKGAYVFLNEAKAKKK